MKGDVHVVPVQDLIEHACSRACWCAPQAIQEDGGGWVIQHRPADNRLTYEQVNDLAYYEAQAAHFDQFARRAS